MYMLCVHTQAYTYPNKNIHTHTTTGFYALVYGRTHLHIPHACLFHILPPELGVCIQYKCCFVTRQLKQNTSENKLARSYAIKLSLEVKKEERSKLENTQGNNLSYASMKIIKWGFFSDSQSKGSIHNTRKGLRLIFDTNHH